MAIKEIASTVMSSDSGESANTSSSSNLGTIGGALDSLGLSVGGWTDRMINLNQMEKQNDLAQQRLELQRDQFAENKRRYGLEFALNELSARRGWAIADVQNVYSMLGQQQNLLGGEYQLAAQRAAADKRSTAKSFLKGFTQAQVGRK